MHPRELSILDFTYTLPAERIAQRPLEQRDASKLLVLDANGIRDRPFTALPGELPPGTLMVLNDTRVVQARIAFRRSTGALIECMVLAPAADRPIELALMDKGLSRWWCMVGNAKRWKGEELRSDVDGSTLHAERVELKDGEHLIEFRWSGDGAFLEQLQHFGSVPLPPYMRRPAEALDDVRYNTVFADRSGSVAAPTASLHFTTEQFSAMAERNISTTRVTLHVGAGTFLPVKSDRMNDHTMHGEQVRITRATVETLLAQLGRGSIVPVGTTALRTIESLFWFGADVLKRPEAAFDIDQWRAYTDGPVPEAREALGAVLDRMQADGTESHHRNNAILIAPGYRFRLVDGLVTNFHQPQSTLLLLVAALVGPAWRAVYDHALANGYRFLSYGDSSLLWARK